MKVWPVLGVAILQAFLLLAHWFLFLTVIHFFPLGGSAREALGAALLVLALSFVAAAFWSFRQTDLLSRTAYKAAAVWLGFLNFFFWAACLCRLAKLGLWLAGRDTAVPRLAVAAALFGLAALAGVYGLVNARLYPGTAGDGRASQTSGGMARPDRSAGQRSAPWPCEWIAPGGADRRDCEAAEPRHSVYRRRFVRRLEGESQKASPNHCSS